MNSNRLNARGEDGWALVTAVSMMAIMLVIGLATLTTVDFNTQQTRELREREASLNLTEGVLYAQAFTLARKWPTPNKEAFPAFCSSANATGGQCPNRENLSAANASNPATAAFNGTDFLKEGSWTTRVRDNYGALAGTYDPQFADAALDGAAGSCAAPCTRDFNDDRALWVEARSIVRGQARKVVALMQLEQIQEGIPRTGITTGALALTNNGGGSYDGTGASVTVRCVPDSQNGNASTCTNFSQNNTVTPAPVQGTVGNLMKRDQIERFRERAIIDGTYYVTCPPSSEVAKLTGTVVFIEYCPADGQNPGTTYTPQGSVCANPPSTPALPAGMSSSCTNSISKPGLLIIRCGGLRISGGTFVGVLYLVNGSDENGDSCNGSGMPAGQTTGNDRGNASNPGCPTNGQRNPSVVVLDIQNGGGVWGAIAADGGACIQLGSNGHQFDFDANVFSAVKSYGTVGLVQNTWRELPPGAN